MSGVELKWEWIGGGSGMWDGFRMDWAGGGKTWTGGKGGGCGKNSEWN